MLELSESNENLRETLFFKLLGKSLLFKSKKDMLTFRSDDNMRTEFTRLYSLDGYMIKDDSIFSLMPKKLDYIFGQQNTLESKPYMLAKKGIMIV